VLKIADTGERSRLKQRRTLSIKNTKIPKMYLELLGKKNMKLLSAVRQKTTTTIIIIIIYNNYYYYCCSINK